MQKFNCIGRQLININPYCSTVCRERPVFLPSQLPNGISTFHSSCPMLKIAAPVLLMTILMIQWKSRKKSSLDQSQVFHRISTMLMMIQIRSQHDGCYCHNSPKHKYTVSDGLNAWYGCKKLLSPIFATVMNHKPIKY